MIYAQKVVSLYKEKKKIMLNQLNRKIMKYSEILKAVLYMEDVKNQGMLEFTKEDEKEFYSILCKLEDIFGDIDEDESWLENMEWNKKYFYSMNPLCSSDTLSNKNPEMHCYPVPYIIVLKDGREINLYDVED